MKMNLFNCVLAAACLISAEAGASTCVDAEKMPTVEVSGKIQKIDFELPNGNSASAYMLNLEQPLCFTQIDEASRTIQAKQESRIQITGSSAGLVSDARLKITGSLTVHNFLSAYYLSDASIALDKVEAVAAASPIVINIQPQSTTVIHAQMGAMKLITSKIYTCVQPKVDGVAGPKGTELSQLAAGEDSKVLSDASGSTWIVHCAGSLNPRPLPPPLK